MQDRLGVAVRLTVATILVGFGAGLAGIAASLLLHGVEHLAYAYGSGTFLHALGTTAPWRRVLALLIAGLIGGFGWWALHRWGRPIVSIASSVAGRAMPALSTVIHVTLQIVIVGLGASIGREVAPRELGALVAGRVSSLTRLSARQRRIFVACGAGAGLAAVYHVPLGGAMFAVEILLVEFTPATLVPALATSGIATLVSALVIPVQPFYAVPSPHSSLSLLGWALVAGPALGLAATGFNRLANRAERSRPRSWRIAITMPVVFVAVGVVSLALPAILGNGRALAQTVFDQNTPIALIALLVVAKASATLMTIASGAHGGTLTPSFSVGAALGAATGGLWAMWWPGSGVVAFALVAAASFLAGSMAAPMTALLLTLEFTGTGTTVIGPMVLAVAGSMAVRWAFDRRRARIRSLRTSEQAAHGLDQTLRHGPDQAPGRGLGPDRAPERGLGSEQVPGRGGGVSAVGDQAPGRAGDAGWAASSRKRITAAGRRSSRR